MSHIHMTKFKKNAKNKKYLPPLLKELADPNKIW